MEGDLWAPRERGWAALLATVLLGAVLYPLRQHSRPHDQRVDGFPLSYYPMFSALRCRTVPINYVVAVSADGSRRYLPYGRVGSGGLNQVRRQLKRVVGEGRVGEFVAVLAARLAAEPSCADVVRVEVRRGEFDLDECLMSHQVAASAETLLAAADVIRMPSAAPALAEVEVSTQV